MATHSARSLGRALAAALLALCCRAGLAAEPIPLGAPPRSAAPASRVRIVSATAPPAPAPTAAAASPAPAKPEPLPPCQDDRPPLLQPEPIAAGPPTPASTGTTTLADLQALALAQHPGIAQAAARVRAARGEWVQAGLPPNPVLGYEGGEIGNEKAHGMQGGFVQQQLLTGRKRQLSRNAAAWDIREAERQLSAQRQRVVNDVAAQFFTTLVAQKTVELNEQLVQIGTEGVRVTESAFRAKQVARTDVLQAQIELDTAQIALRAARNTHSAAWRQLAAVVGSASLAPASLSGDLARGVPKLAWESSLAQVLGESPEIAAARARTQGAGWRVARARAEAVPNVDLMVGLQHDNASSDDVTNVTVSLPLPLWNRNQGGVIKAQAERLAAERNVDRVALDLQHRLAAAFARYATAQETADVYGEKVVPRSKETLDLILTGYRAGQQSYLNVLTAQRTYFQTSLSYLDALRELRESIVQIEGLLLTGSLQEQP